MPAGMTGAVGASSSRFPCTRAIGISSFEHVFEPGILRHSALFRQE